MQKSLSGTNNFHEVVIFHTTARNVGLFTSLSLASLGAARALHNSGRDDVAAACAVCASLFLWLAIDLNRSLMATVSKEDYNNQISYVLPHAVAAAHALMCLVIVVAAYRGFTKWRLAK